MEDNRKFAEKFSFPFKLLSDPDRKIGVPYGAADETDSKYAKRIAYVIERGRIKNAYNVKDPAGHAAQVLQDVGAA